jgi:hypothetical protein
MINISDLVKDWGGFEKLVAKLNETGEVTVEHNVTLIGQSGAPRQIDVLIKHKQGLYEHSVIAECKYWNSPVERIHVDALAITVREVHASKGVIFSTKGFQSGAITQAAHDNIELFKVRDLTTEEWGNPGRLVQFYLHVVSVSVGNLHFNNTFSHVGFEPRTNNLEIHFDDPSLDKDQIMDGQGIQEKTLGALIQRFAFDSAYKNYKPTLVKFDDGFNGNIRFRTNVNIKPELPINVNFNGGIICIPSFTFDVGVTISQSKIEIDRGNNYVFALAVEDCVRNKVVAAFRSNTKKLTEQVCINEHRPDNLGKPYHNGSLITAWAKGLHGFDDYTNLELGKAVFSKPTAT